MVSFNPAFKSPQDSCNEVLQTLRDSSLNFLVNESPYSIQICIRKRFLKDAPKQNKTEDKGSAANIEILEKKIEALAAENGCLIDELEEANKALKSSYSTNDILHAKIDKAEKEMFKHYSELKDSETKKKDAKKKVETEIGQLQDHVKALNKSNKLKDKEIYDLSKHMENARDTIKNLKSDKSTLKIGKSKLESEVKKFQKNLVKKISYSVKETQTDPDLVSNPSLVTPSSPQTITSSSPSPTCTPTTASQTSRVPSSMISSVSNPSLTPSLVSHWIPTTHKISQSPSSILTMVTHCAKLPSPGDQFLSMEEVLEEMKKWLQEYNEKWFR